MKKSIKVFVLSIITCLCCFLSVSCNNTIEVTLLEEAFRPDAYVGEEYDVMNAIEEPNLKYKYKITECFYLDNSLNRFEITPNGTKFTQNMPFDILVTLEVKKGLSKIELEFEINIEVIADSIQKSFLKSYSTGTQKLMSADPNYLYEGAKSAVKVTVNATTNNKAEGTAIGSLASSVGSKTSYNNPVLTAKIYNDYDRDLMIGLNISLDGLTLDNLSMFENPILLKSKQWNDVNFSFRAMGLNDDFDAKMHGIGLKTMLPNTNGLVAPYRYRIYICNLDIVDYSEERFPDLETRTTEEIIAQEGFDAQDAYLVTHNKPLGTVISNLANTFTTASVKKYDSSTVAKPDGLTTDSFVEYSITATMPNANNYLSTAINYKTGWASSIITEQEKALISVDNWEKAFVGFWAYNDGQSSVFAVAKTTNGVKKEIPVGKWTYVEYSLVDVYGITTNIFEEEEYVFRLLFNSSSTGFTDNETYKDFCAKIYVDGFSFYNKEPNSYVTLNGALVGSAVKDHAVGYNYFYTSVNATEDGTEKYNGENTVKYTISDDGRSTTAGRRWFATLEFDELNPFNALLSTVGKSKEDITANTRVRFYVKNTSSYQLRFIFMQGDFIDLNDVDSALSTTSNVIVPANSGWVKVDLPLSTVYQTLIDESEKVSLCAGYLSTTNPFNEQTFYMGGFEVYTPTTNDILVGSAVQSYRDSENSYNYFYTNLLASEDSTEKYNGENTVKYTVSDDGRSTTAGRRWFVPMEFNAGNPFSNLLATMDMSVEDITANTRVCFYAKNASTSYELAFVLMDTSKKWFTLGDISSLGGSSFNEGITHINIPANSGWTKVDFSLSDVYESLINGTGRISLCAGYINTGNPFVDQTYYMGGFEVYESTVEDNLPDYALYKAGYYEAGKVTATTTTLNNEKVVKYDVIISEKITNQTSTNINSNMFVADQKMPSDILEQCNVTATSWTSMTITFKVYSDVVIGFNTFYKNGTGRFDGLISGSATPHASSKAGEWTTITLTVENPTSSTFDDYAFRIGTRSILSGSYNDYKEVGTEAYTYYVKDFNITIS